MQISIGIGHKIRIHNAVARRRFSRPEHAHKFSDAINKKRCESQTNLLMISVFMCLMWFRSLTLCFLSPQNYISGKQWTLTPEKKLILSAKLIFCHHSQIKLTEQENHNCWSSVLNLNGSFSMEATLRSILDWRQFVCSNWLFWLFCALHSFVFCSFMYMHARGFSQAELIWELQWANAKERQRGRWKMNNKESWWYRSWKHNISLYL